jgi:hypothetical protein
MYYKRIYVEVAGRSAARRQVTHSPSIAQGRNSTAWTGDDAMAPKKTQHQPEDGISENEVRSLLIGRDGNLTRDFEAVLTRLFISFLESPTDKSLTLDKLREFSKICNDGKPFSDEEIKEIQTYFQCDENKGLTLKGFKDMYHTQSSAEPMESWRDLKKLGCVLAHPLVSYVCRFPPSNASWIAAQIRQGAAGEARCRAALPRVQGAVVARVLALQGRALLRRRLPKEGLEGLAQEPLQGLAGVNAQCARRIRGWQQRVPPGTKTRRRRRRRRQRWIERNVSLGLGSIEPPAPPPRAWRRSEAVRKCRTGRETARRFWRRVQSEEPRHPGHLM